ncbi:thermonuclease family protein [Mesorhizobium sp. ASY16-5R]|uniref:thermonuclease family protein n=1 Tax=Mesorhizobium sp. ASY16-5R TaxID=3445772 RepID=UPI003F9F115E
MAIERQGRRNSKSIVPVWSMLGTLFALMSLAPAAAEPLIVGRASVIDGDTIEIHGQRIRFNGIDAPENWQTCSDRSGAKYRCGKDSADALDAFLAKSRPTTCEQVDTDRYGRAVANCFRADGLGVAAWLVRNGHALDWPRYSKGAFAAVQQVARRDRLGMWQGEFIEPWKARRK